MALPPISQDRGAIVSAPLIRAHAVELADDLASLAVSLREALWRGSDVLVAIHSDEIRLVWREIARSYNELQKIEGRE
ncbi:hypothetical protein ACNHKD_12725 [Methylocystis sp. JAN1]|uniref:hypothetical protein n=1 Tax=Methylocystis sp. JAN1 TaxID=3397211 RepID=UPI003FA267D2